jgi:GDP/UDP-N,N'-diacetylbacillosamine 2-epimerase (hydrolysing)
MGKRKICFITGSRAEYGLMSRLMKKVQNDNELQLQIIATNMHLSPEFGLTYREIENDGLHIDKKVDMLLSGDSSTATVKSLGIGILGFADAYEDLRPDLIVVLGDRYEILGAVEAALIFRIPVAHISGGDITEGAYDDAIRHSITKMSHLHFPTTKIYRKRVIQLGEQPDHVWNVGNIAIDNIHHTNLLSHSEFEESIHFKLDQLTALVTFHPVTLEGQTAEEQCHALLDALDEQPLKIIFTMPNSDSNGRIIIKLINEYVECHPEKAIAFTSLGYLRYLSALQYVGVVVGNSSSGIVEVPSFHLPTINIGDRQKGRLQAESIINCLPTLPSIREAFAEAFNPKNHLRFEQVTNPYEQPDTANRIYQTIKSFPLEGLITKHFYDL